MKAAIARLAHFANVMPTTWLLAALAAIVAAGLLSAFVDALHENLRRGEELRLTQGRPQPTLVTVANAATAQVAAPAPLLR
jgi:hypothetical protein